MSRIRDLASILTASSSMATDTEVSAVSAQIPANVAGKNGVINGAMDFWQRGNSIPFGNNYTADRWHGYYSPSLATMSRSTDKPSGFQYSLKAQRNPSVNAPDVVYTSYMMESADSYKYQGQTVTISFYAKAGANYSPVSNHLNITLRTTTSTNGNVIVGPWDNSTNIINQNSTLTTSWQRFSYTGVVGATANQIAIVFGSYNTGTAGADDSYYITGVQLEIGSVATPFSRAGGTIQGELAACQRYYYRTNNNDSTAYGVFGFGYSFANNLGLILVNFPVTMRTTPNSFDYQLHGYINYNNAGRSLTSIAVNQATRSSCWLQYNITGGVQGEPVFAQMNAGSGYLAFGAEL
jgi:hypothetical protein